MTRFPLPLRLVGMAALVLTPAACHKAATKAATVETAPVTRQDIVVAVEATGVIEPRDAVQVKSKASGQIVRMPVEVGSQVRRGDLLVQVDQRQNQSLYNEAVAAVRTARENLNVAVAQRQRADQLFAQRVMTVTEHEAALTAEANARSQLASAQSSVTISGINLADVTIRAPIAGTVIDKSVSEGQVISSATGNVSGGTTLLTLANLGNILDSTLVNESDIGQLQSGQQASVTVDAYPNRVFRGTVERVAPQATVQQSVTMFPVLIGLDNSQGLLKPGMNSDVSILVQQVINVIAVPNDAITRPRDAISAAMALGVDSSSVRKLVGNGRGGNGQGSMATGGVSAGPRGMGATTGVDGAPGGGANGGGGNRSGRRGGGRAGQSGGGRTGNGTGNMSAAGGAGMAGGGMHRAVVFVAQQDGSFAPRLVTLGVANYDVTQVISGLQEGDRVALISGAMLQQARDSLLSRIRSRSGLPGIGGATGGGGGGGGARRGGGGR